MLILFIKDMLRQRKRFFLTSLAIAWGTTSMVLFLAFGEGLKRNLAAGLRGLGDGILIMSGGSTGKPFEGLPTARRVRLTPEDMELLRRQIPEIGGISVEFQSGDQTLTAGTVSATQNVRGVYPDFGELRTHMCMAGGRFVNDRDIADKRRVVFLGNVLEARLFGGANAGRNIMEKVITNPDFRPGSSVGKTVLLHGSPFTVIGVMQEKLQTSMYSGPDSWHACIPASTYQTLYGARYINRIIIRPRTLELAPRVEQRVREVLAGKYRFDPEDRRAVSCWDVIKNAETENKILFGIQAFLGVVGSMTLCIAGGGVANIMYVIVRRRTREIGLKMALGAKRRLILIQVLLESIIITLLGGVVGLPLTVLIIRGYIALPNKGQALEFLGTPIISPEVAVGTVMFLGCIGLIAGFFPARRAASLHPMEALRYE